MAQHQKLMKMKLVRNDHEVRFDMDSTVPELKRALSQVPDQAALVRIDYCEDTYITVLLFREEIQEPKADR